MNAQGIIKAIKQLQNDYNALIIKVSELESQLKSTIVVRTPYEEPIKRRVGRPRRG